MNNQDNWRSLRVLATPPRSQSGLLSRTDVFIAATAISSAMQCEQFRRGFGCVRGCVGVRVDVLWNGTWIPYTQGRTRQGQASATVERLALLIIPVLLNRYQPSPSSIPK